MFGGYFKNRSTPVTYATSDIQSLLAGGDGNPVSHTAASAPRDEPGEKELLGRLTIKWTPTDRLTATFKASGDYNMVNNNSWNYVTFYRSEEHTSELQSLMRISYAVFCLKKKK